MRKTRTNQGVATASPSPERRGPSREPDRRTFTDRFLQSLKRSEFAGRRIVYDDVVPGLGAHKLQTQVSFVLVARAPGAKYPTRMPIGEYSPLTDAEQRAAKAKYAALPTEQRSRLGFDEYVLQTYGATTLIAAREKARKWRMMLKAGVDPRTVEARERAAAQAAASNRFKTVCEQYIARELPTQRCGARVARVLRTQVLPHLGARPIADISHRDVIAVTDAIVMRGARAFARNVFDAIRGVFSFAVARGIVAASPCAMIKPSKIIGAKAIKTRVLDDGELRRVWAAAGAAAYPFGDLVRALMLTGTRLNEMAGARWREVDLERRVFVVPAERFKSNVPHMIPISDDLLALFEGLPRFQRGDHLFSASFGERPVTGFSWGKRQIDARVGAIPPWSYHDLRRTFRTKLSELRVPEPICELAVGHSKRGLIKVYDQHRFEVELREAFDAWAARLRSIVTPPPDNVVHMQKAGAP
jgi:integrase